MRVHAVAQPGRVNAGRAIRALARGQDDRVRVNREVVGRRPLGEAERKEHEPEHGDSLA